MEKKIEDYLHLYLGCEVFVQLQGVFSTEKALRTKLDSYILHSFYTKAWASYKHCFPILRPLSDITDNEKEEFREHMVWLIFNIEEFLFSHTNRLR